MIVYPPFPQYERFTPLESPVQLEQNFLTEFTTSIIIFMLGFVSEQIAQLRMDKTEDYGVELGSPMRF